MKYPSLTLAMIVKNEEKNLEKCIKSVSENLPPKMTFKVKVLDTGSTDKTIEILERLKEEFKGNLTYEAITPDTHPDFFVDYLGKIRLKFAKARNRSFEDIKTDWVMWLDGDDTFVGAELIPEKLMIANSKGVTDIACTYLYDVDKDGNILGSHPKERFLKVPMYRWEILPEYWLVHENPYIKDEYKKDYLSEFDPNFSVLHGYKTSEEKEESGLRNLQLLQWMSEQDALKNDPRLAFLLGREAFGAGMFDLGAKYYTAALQLDISDGDKLVAYKNLHDLAEVRGDYESALDFAFKCTRAKPTHPLGFLLVAKMYILLGKYKEALKYLGDAGDRDLSALDNVVATPHYVRRLTALLTSELLDRLERYEESYSILSEYLSTAPSEDVKLLAEELEELGKKIQVQKILKAFDVMANLEMIKQSENVPLNKTVKFDVKPFLDLIDRLPPGMRRVERVFRMFKTIGHYEVRPKNSIDIYCALNFEKWDPETIIKNGGGGSETAVIEQASRFQKAGFNVTVWANPTKPNTKYKGVMYRNHTDINFADDFDIFISWRNPHVLKDHRITARIKDLWLQDIMMPQDYTVDLIDQLDKIIVLSKYHRMTAKHVPESKFYYTTNGINLKLIKEVEKEMKGVKRTKGKCIYASSADRGLEPLVLMWEYVKTYAPTITGTWYYGWNSWIEFQKGKGGKAWKKKMQKGLKKVGIVEGGRIGKKELYKEYFTADLWVYPLIGGAETSCITAMEAQACGAIPVTTGITALEETQKFGIKVKLEDYPDTLIKAVNAIDSKETEKYRKQMMKWARETFDWDKVAAAWIKDLF